MTPLRKDYIPLLDARLDRLKADTLPLLGTIGCITLPAKTVYWMVMELIDSREEIFRLQLCETVEQILADELEAEDDEEDFLAFRWPDDYCVGDDYTNGVLKPAFPCKETSRLADIVARPADASPTDTEGGRMPRVD